MLKNIKNTLHCSLISLSILDKDDANFNCIIRWNWWKKILYHKYIPYCTFFLCFRTLSFLFITFFSLSFFFFFTYFPFFFGFWTFPFFFMAFFSFSTFFFFSNCTLFLWKGEKSLIERKNWSSGVALYCCILLTV